MGLRFTVLSSGSTGNATVVENEDARLLVDAGLSAKRVDELLQERGVSGEELDGILVTHEHSDHIKGLGALARKYDLPVYANEATWEALNKHIGEIAEEKRIVMNTGEALDFGTLRVESYGISHDAAEPVGYCFYDGDEKLSLATDLGYVSEKVKQAIEDSDVLVLEANHDIEMLRMGKYPWNIKRRILGDLGHLSNETAGEALCELATGNTRRVYLAHLSREHNMMDLAKMTVRDVMESNGYFFKDSELQLRDTYYDRPTPWDKVSEK
ncbi:MULTISPECIES: MBL fold metallo-hydrolase [unclassified Paenibacillus]|uniref:MBL fold metallo-hydrolase n=1 Tax=unclassified Paenibacillus TaxID=185978 RepID=UPI001C0FB6E6|nr:MULTISPECIES: MBL fold metallo-hydrolase [unclassified Paenibacillus]MBU5441905.1 MBL fold metallo-hydrolase [Paenibacillus sp. MSJ-34]CAH0121346.1 Putative metallo-hydrolase YycJ [Paenibacillus sp. CECT 9249]